MWPLRGSRRQGRASLLVGAVAAAAIGHAISNRQGSCNCGEHQKVRLTATGQADARAAVLQWTDIGPAPGWSGGARTPLPPGTDECPGYHPKQSDLVRIGSALTDYEYPSAVLSITSAAAVLQTPQMVQLDLRRTVRSPQFLPCLRANLPATLDPSMQFVQVAPLAFPRVAPSTTAWRETIEARVSHVRVVTDEVVLARGQTEITLVVRARLSDMHVVRPLEITFARSLVARIRA